MFCSVHLGVQMDIRELNSTMMSEGRGGVIGASRGGIDNGEWRYQWQGIFLTIIEIDSFTKKEYFTSLLSRHLSSIGNGMPKGK